MYIKYFFFFSVSISNERRSEFRLRRVRGVDRKSGLNRSLNPQSYRLPVLMKCIVVTSWIAPCWTAIRNANTSRRGGGKRKISRNRKGISCIFGKFSTNLVYSYLNERKTRKRFAERNHFYGSTISGIVRS